ncbi:MAG TPA: hypothetical protein VI818_05360 [Candidatus Thermoplasmatota archaeon]|nr:hypothetical protein [Candidatus Thermoplasmatota archaeon]
MQLYGNGVTKNFLTILEDDIRRSARAISRVLILVVLLAAAGLLAYFTQLGWATLLVGAAFLLAFGLGYAWGHFVNTYRYQASIREHWNRWMRFSISCVTVRECYRKVHGKRTTNSLFWATMVLSLLLITHGVVLGLAANGGANPWYAMVLFIADAGLLGIIAGIRWRERRWYREFLTSVNELLKEGTIGVWGVY